MEVCCLRASGHFCGLPMMSQLGLAGNGSLWGLRTTMSLPSTSPLLTPAPGAHGVAQGRERSAGSRGGEWPWGGRRRGKQGFQSSRDPSGEVCPGQRLLLSKWLALGC